MSPIIAKIRQHAVSWVSRAFTLGLQVVIMRVLTSQWDIEAFGHYLYLVAIVSMGTLFDMGLAVAVQNRLSQIKAHGGNTKDVYSSLIPLTVLLGIAFFTLGSGVIAILLHYNPAFLPIPYGLLGVSILFGLSQVFLRTVYAEGHGEFAYYAQSVFLAVFLGGLCCYFYLFCPASPPSATGLLLLYYALFITANIAVGYWKGGKRALHLCRPPWDEIKRLAKRSLGFWAYAGIGFFITQIDVIILGYIGAFAALTYYTVLCKVFFGVCYTFLSVYLSLAHPKITVAWEQGDQALAFRYLKRMLGGGFAMTLFFTLGFEYFKEGLIGILIINPDVAVLQEVWVYGFYLFFATRIVSDCCLTFLMALSRVKRINVISCLQGAFSVLLQIAFVQWWGIQGIVAALWISYLFSVVLYLFALNALRTQGKLYASASP